MVICSVGGGGLFNGIMQGFDALGTTTASAALPWKKPLVLALETKGAESLAASLAEGEVVTLPGITSRATSLGAVRVTERTFAYAQRENVRSVVLGDEEAAMGCWRLADDERVMVELACGVGVALCYDGRLEEALGRKVAKEEKVVVVLCGGSNVTVDMLAKWREEFGWVEKEVQGKGGMAPSAVTAPR